MEEKEKTKFKIEARMLSEDVLGYKDVALNASGHRNKDIVRVVDGSMVLAVVGKLATPSNN